MPYSEAYLALEAQFGGRAQTLLEGTPEELREKASASGRFLASLRTPPQNSTTSTDGQHNGVAYRVYNPQRSQRLPVCIWAHGGGLMLGSIEDDDHLCRLLAEKVPCVIVSVDYRLSPEHKVPAHLEDVLTICHWVHENVDQLGADCSKLFVGGVSAGAALALQVANHFTATSADASFIKGVLALCPFTVHPDNIPEHWKSLHRSYKENEVNVPFIDKKAMQNFFRHAGARPDDQRTFVALAELNYKKFPPVALASCEYDPLRDDAFALDRSLSAAGIRTQYQEYKGLPHCFWVFPMLPETSQFETTVVKQARWLIESMPP